MENHPLVPGPTPICSNLGVSSMCLHNSVPFGPSEHTSASFQPSRLYFGFSSLFNIFYLIFHPDSWSNLGPEPIWFDLEFSEDSPEPQKPLNLGIQAGVTQQTLTGPLQGKELPWTNAGPVEAMVTMFIRDLGLSRDEEIRSSIRATIFQLFPTPNLVPKDRPDFPGQGKASLRSSGQWGKGRVR